MACPLITFLVSVFFNFAIVACYSIGWILVFGRFFSHNRFLQHGRILVFFWFLPSLFKAMQDTGFVTLLLDPLVFL
jgi:hypothetical protein